MRKPIRVLAAPTAYVLNDTATESLGLFSYQLMKALREFGVEFLALCMRSEISNEIPNVKIYELLEDAQLNQISFLKFMWRYFCQGKKLLVHEKINLVHHMFPFGYGIGFNPLLLGGYAREYPSVLGPVLAPHTPEVDLTDEKAITKQYGASESYSPSKSIRIDSSLKLVSPVTRYLFEKTLNKANVVIAADKYTEGYYKPYVMKEKLEVLRIGIDLDKFSPVEKKVNSERKREILTTGHLSQRKGIRYLILAMKQVLEKYPESYLRIVGDGPQRPFLQKLVRDSSLDNFVVFEESVPHDDISRYYQGCDIFCLPALSETWVALQEAMACGKPVITTNVGSHPEHVIEGKCGFLVPPRTIEPLSRAIIKLLENPSQREEMGKAARRHMEENYSWRKIAQQYYNLYQELLRKKR